MHYSPGNFSLDQSRVKQQSSKRKFEFTGPNQILEFIFETGFKMMGSVNFQINCP
jgi:hypothetical protein